MIKNWTTTKIYQNKDEDDYEEDYEEEFDEDYENNS